MKKCFFFLLIVLGSVLSCKQEAPSAEDAVMQQAQQYYQSLLNLGQICRCIQKIQK